MTEGKYKLRLEHLLCQKERKSLQMKGTCQKELEGTLSEYSLEGLILTLKLQYFDHLLRRANSLEKTLMLGKIEGRRERRWQRIRRLDGIINSTDMTLSKLWEIVKDWRAAVHGLAKSRTQLRDWTTAGTRNNFYDPMYDVIVNMVVQAPIQTFLLPFFLMKQKKTDLKVFRLL